MAADNELAVVVRAVVGDFIGGMNRAKAEVVDFADTTGAALQEVEARSEDLRHVWKDLFEAFIGVEIVSVLRNIASAADSASEKLDIAAQTARNFGKAFNADAMEQWLRKFARSAQGGGYAIDDMRTAVQRFAATGQSGAQIQRALADSANLAASRNISFAQAAQIVEYALTGHVDMLTRYGVVSREAAKNIHTVEQAMQALEHATAGAAAKRTDDLAGAFGRLGNSVTLLADSFGKYLIPYFDATADALSHLADAFSKLPAWLQQAAAGTTFVTLALTALGLMLPATKLGVEFLGNAFGLLRAAASIAWRALGLLSKLLVGPLVSAFRGLISYVRIAVTAIGTDLVGAEAGAALGASEFIAPALAVIAAIAGIAFAIAALSGHWGEFTRFMGTAWSEFTKNFIHNGKAIREYLQGLVLFMGGNFADGQKLMGEALQATMPKTYAAASATAAQVEQSIMGALRRAWSAVTGFFGANASNAAVPHPPFDGTIPGKSAKGAHHGAGHAGKVPVGKGEATVYFQVPQMAMQSTAPLEQQLESVRHAEAMARASGALTPVQSAQFAAQRAAIEEEIARIKEANAARALENAQIREKVAEPHSAAEQAARAAVARAQEHLAQSHVALAKAANQAAEALAAFRTAANNSPQTFIGKLGDALKQFLARKIPGLDATQKPGGGIGLSFNWVTLLLDAFSKTQAFADIMRVVDELMGVFAKMLDALRPVIDLLLKAVISVANGFIDLWNVVARILRVFGIHLQLLQKINGIYGSSPFLDIVHDIPTLNELASGNVSPLYPSGAHDTIINGITGPINDQLKDPSLGGGIISVLGEILGAVLGLKLVMGLFGSGGSGGIVGFLGNLLGLFKKSTMASAVQDGVTAAFTDSAVTGDMGTLTTGVSDGLQQAYDSLQTVPGVNGGGAAATGPFGKLGAWLGGTKIGGATVGSALLAAAGGAVMGDFVGQLFGGGSHSDWGALGGAAGATLGATLGMFGMAAGPLGALAGAALGSIIGSLFGHAGPNAQDNPDIINTGTWGQDNANLWGAGYNGENAMHANGASFNMDPQLAQMTGGKGLLQWLASYISSTGGKGLTAQQIKEFTGLDLATPVVGGKNGTLDLANGIDLNWQQLYQDATSAFQAVFQGGTALSGAAGNILGVAGNITRFVDASTNDLAAQATSTSSAAQAVVAAAATAVGNAMAKTHPGAGGGTHVHTGPLLNINGDQHFYTDSDIDDFTRRQALELARQMRMNPWRLDRGGTYP